MVYVFRGNSPAFVLKLTTGVYLLVHPVKADGQVFLPCAYGWAMTIRRAQGSNFLDLVILRFDRRLADRGYAYVGCSRARRREDVYHMGSIRRTDWRPVGGNTDEEQGEVSALSRASDSEGDRSSEPDSEDEHRWDSLLIQGDADYQESTSETRAAELAGLLAHT